MLIIQGLVGRCDRLMEIEGGGHRKEMESVEGS